MSKFFKRLSALAAVMLMSVMMLVGFYGSALPDSYQISEGEKLMINSLFSISAKPCREKVTAAVTGGNSKGNETLMLFGSVPIKDVKAKTTERPSLIPCGQAFGIKLITDGVMVVDLTKVNGVCPASECGIKEGDIIVSINGSTVKSNADVSKIISGSKGQPCSVIVKRDGASKTLNLVPTMADGSYKAGMWVRDSSAGIGTITYFDPTNNTFGGLGHPICDSDTKEILPLSEGTAGEVRITGCTKSENGKPGQLLGEFKGSAALGSILSNCSDGVFGILNENPSKRKALPMAFRQEVHTGSAYILTSTDGGEPKEYSISIEQVNMNGGEHDLVVKITDPELIAKSGGIVQGMSGSPIIQDGRLVGAVTHVFIDNPLMGYGIFAESMYQKSSTLSDNDVSLAG